MDSNSFVDAARLIALFGGIPIGIVLISTVLYMWVKKQVFGAAGSVLSTFGLVFFGLSLWQSVDIHFGSTEIKLAQAEKALKEVSKQANQVAADAQNPTIRDRATKAAKEAQQAADNIRNLAPVKSIFERLRGF